jgi:hypothetical protein
MAGRSHRSAGTPGRGAAPAATPPVELDTTEVAPIARVKRSRLAFALAVTMAGLPVLVLDNFPATAEPAGRLVAAVVTTAGAPAEATTTMAPASTSAPATEVAPTTTEPAAPTTEAPTTTTTAPPAPTTTKAAVRVAPTTTTAPPTTQPPPSYANGDPNDPATWDRMAQCEAAGNWAANTGNGYYGGLQFSLATWQHYGGTGYPHEASKDAQIAIGKRVQAAEGWGAWPGCARYLGYS